MTWRQVCEGRTPAGAIGVVRAAGAGSQGLGERPFDPATVAQQPGPTLWRGSPNLRSGDFRPAILGEVDARKKPDRIFDCFARRGASRSSPTTNGEATVSLRMRRFETHLILGVTLIWTLVLVRFAQLHGWS
jgi:hypothetical protein